MSSSFASWLAIFWAFLSRSLFMLVAIDSNDVGKFLRFSSQEGGMI